MNVNGARFHLLLGRDDWRRCRASDGRMLGAWWEDVDSPMPVPPDDLPEWDPARHEIALRAQGIALPATVGEAPLTIASRRAAAADRHGNVYRIADDRASLRVTSAGSGNETAFWPDGAADCGVQRARERQVFETHAPEKPVRAMRYLALAVTDDDYLVVAFAREGAGDAARGLLAFDLISGGEPNETVWPVALAIEPFDLRRRHGGGAWLLDRVHRRLWELDCTLAMVNSGQAMRVLDPPETDDFQPHGGPARTRAETRMPEGLDLAALSEPLHDPIAIEALGEDAVLVLDRDDVLQRSRVVRLRRSGSTWNADASAWLDKVLPAQAHDMVHAAGLARAGCATAVHAPARLFIATGIGNQLHAFEVIDDADGFQLRAPAELHPLRRYGGRALVALRGAAHYDSGTAQPRWVRVVQQHRQRFATRAVLTTPVFDSELPGTVWDKLLLDAGIPADTELRIESRTSDERVLVPADSDAEWQTIGDWRPEPTPRLRTEGAELPWLRREAVRDTDRGNGVGTWELLFQQAQGRYLQLRITFASAQGTMTPRLRALRAWAPRFSYPQRFLPAVYREDEGNGDFLERWLANIESTYTAIEDRIAHLETLFDPRTVPQDALPWLAEWFDLALDPAWDERRHRLLVRHAMDFFRWRGTVHGLRTALSLAFDPAFDPAMFDGPTADDEGAGRIRIVEAYLTRITDGLVARANTALATRAAPAASFGAMPGDVVRGALWRPAEGNAGLVDRYATSQGREATPVELMTPFPLVPPSDPDAAAAWSAFCSEQLGVVPSAGAAERARWQAWLRARHASIAVLNAAHGMQYAVFDAIALPMDVPANAAAAADWRAYRDRGEGREPALWHDFLARRHRRIERLRAAHGTHWTRFEDVPLPDRLPGSEAAQTDWLQFERQLLAMHRTAHRFSVLLPMSEVEPDPHQLDARLALARRIVELEKPAHTVFDVRFFWAFNRVGEARLGLDTQLGAGSRASELIPTAVVGRAYIGASFVGGDALQRGRDRLSIEC